MRQHNAARSSEPFETLTDVVAKLSSLVADAKRLKQG